MVSGPRNSAAARAVASALRLRATHGITPEQPVRVFDIAEQAGVVVWFLGLPTLEGSFVSEPATIFLSSLRPSGRQAFTCAHELGHWSFGDTCAIDEIHQLRLRPRSYTPN
jgi:Zn-dependent peptidase ImmA (M78 family)